MAYAFTLMRSADAGKAAKRGIRVGHSIEWRPYDHVKFWRMYPGVVGSNATMANGLRVLGGRARLMIVAGAPIPGLDLTMPQYRRSNSADPSTNTLMGVPRDWMAIDLDDIAVPPPLGNGDRLPEAAAFARDSVLPEEFRDVEMVVTATAKTGLTGPDSARLRIFCQLDREHPLESLHAWADAAKIAGIPIDPAVLQPHQPIYTSRPILKGIDDPVPPDLRAFVLAGSSGDRVFLDIHRFDAEAAEIKNRLRYTRRQQTEPRRRHPAGVGDREPVAGYGDDWQALLEQTLGGPLGFHEPMKRGIGLALRVGADPDDIFDFVDNLLDQRADRGRRAQYNEQWLHALIDSFRGRDAVAAAEIATLKNRLLRR